METSDQTQQKYEKMLGILRSMESAVLGFSGGVDSTFLLAALKASGIRYLAVTGASPTMPAHDLQDVQDSITALGVTNHRIIDSGEIEDADFVKNPTNRCFFCKSNLFDKLTALARAEGYACVLDGTTTDDLADYRPGMQAKDRFEVRSPIMEAGLGKGDVRELSRRMGLKTWDKPASPCLSSRIPYGDPIEVESLRMIDQAEDGLKAMGFSVLRVRKFKETAKIELPEESMDRMLDPTIRKRITNLLLDIGFKYVTLDLEGFKSGKLNRVIPISPVQAAG